MKETSSYKDLDIYKESLDLFYRVHIFSLGLPKNERFEMGSQLRRAADSVNTNIVEGYGRRRYKQDFVKFLVYSHSSALETKLYLEKVGHLYESLRPEADSLLEAYEALSIRIYKFLKYVDANWRVG
jgi:four helix bundle protein